MLFRVLSLIALISAPIYAAQAEPLKLQACHIPNAKLQMRCGTFHVPENRAISGGRMLALKVIVIPSAKQPAKEPVFFLSGGPGQAATDSAAYLPATAWQHQDHDLVLVDMRGTGEGTRLDCALGGSDDDIQDYLEPLFHNGSRYGACAAQLSKHADLSQYTTPNAMRDLDALRVALGYNKIDLDGGSYGTRAGLVYLHMFGQNVHAAILSGLAPLANRAPLYHAAAAQRAFEMLAAQCADDPACRTAYPDPKADLAAILAALRAKPASVTVKHPVSGKPTAITLSASAFADGLRVMLYDEHEGREVPLRLKEARAGNYVPFAEAALENDRGLTKSLAMGLLLAVSCTEDVARIHPDEIAKETAGSFIGDWRVRGQMAACAVWPKTQLPADYAAPFTSNVPVLLVSGNLDPVTPPRWGVEAQHSLPNSLHVVMPGAHVAGNDCVDAMNKTLFDTGSVKAIDTSCAAATKLPPFALPKN